MKLWLATLPARYQSLYFYLTDWCDATASEARKAVEQAIRDDVEFERAA